MSGKGGATGTGGTTGTGGAGTGGSTTDGGSTTSPVDCTAIPAIPTGGTTHNASTQGGSGSLAWQVWSNQNSGSITTYSTPAFSAAWGPSSGDFLARIGVVWNNTKTYDQYGTITADFAYTKTGSGGGYSYIGIYGWSVSPCVEWYIVDDSYNKMPVNPGSCTNMSNSPLSIDGGKYTMCVRNTSGTGGDRCGGAGNWNQYYSIRQDNRTCGTISVTEHFKAWAAAGNKLGNLLEVKVLLEVGGGTGTVDFPIANVTKTQ